MINFWYSNGKFLITGEYLVLDGASALALPLKVGQNLGVEYNNSRIVSWKAEKPSGHWFKCELKLPDYNILSADNLNLAKKISSILRAVSGMSVDFEKKISAGVNVTTNLDFNTEFGMGSSSTLISNLAWWADVDPYKLLKLTFGGSGYDIACARNNKPIVFSRIDESVKVDIVNFNPDFKDYIYFAYLGKKQSSAKSIIDFKKNAVINNADINNVSKITEELVNAGNLDDFEKLIIEHEKIISRVIDRPTIMQKMFNDYQGSVKSMGGWGGDFVMLTWQQSAKELKNYLATKGIKVMYSFDEIVLD